MFYSTWGIPFMEDQLASPFRGKTAQPFFYNPPSGISGYMKPSTSVRSSFWEGFKDPHGIYYKTYNQMQWESEETLDKVWEAAEHVKHFDRLDDAYRAFIASVWPPLRFVEWGVVKVMENVGHYSPSSPVDACATFQITDGLRFVQRNISLSLRLNLSNHRQLWLEDAAWQPYRQVVEKLLSIDDWVEAVVATNVVFKPFLWEVLMKGLEDVAAEVRDLYLIPLLEELGKDAVRHVDWGRALVQFLVEDPHYGSENRPELQRWLDAWRDEVASLIEPTEKLLQGRTPHVDTYVEHWEAFLDETL